MVSNTVNKNSFWGSFIPQSCITVALALPMIMGQVGQLLLSVFDTIMVGHVGVAPLAGVSFGGGLMLFLFIIAMGLCSAVHVYIAHSSGPDKKKHDAEVLKHGIWIVLGYSIPLAILVHWGIDFLNYFGQPEEVLVHAKPYVIFMAWSIAPGLLFRTFRNYYEALNRPWDPFWATLFFVVLNIFLNWVFIFGHLGAPAMGAAGAGLGTLLARVAGLIVIVFMVLRDKEFDICWRIRDFFAIKWDMTKKMLHVGGTTMVQIAFEFGFFTMATIMMGWVGTHALAAQQIVTQYTATLFMVPLSMAFATTIRVGKSMGDKDLNSARNIGFGSTLLGGGFMFVVACFSLIFREQIPLIFIKDVEVVTIAAQLMLFVACMQVWDGVQVVIMGALRGIPDMRMPLCIVVFSYWIVGIPLCYVLAFKYELGAYGIWSGIIIGLFLAAVLLLLRFRHFTTKHL